MPSLPTVLPEIPDLVASRRAEIAAVCREFGVARLEVFGSVMTDEFDPERSDIDFIVHFRPGIDLGPWQERLSELEEALSALLGRHVDIVRVTALDDPYFRFLANLTRTLLLDETEIRAAA